MNKRASPRRKIKKLNTKTKNKIKSNLPIFVIFWKIKFKNKNRCNLYKCASRKYKLQPRSYNYKRGGAQCGAEYSRPSRVQLQLQYGGI